MMRSKPRARKLTQGPVTDMPPITDQDNVPHDTEQLDGHVDSPNRLTIDCNLDASDHHDDLSYMPSSIWSDIDVPDTLELGQSGVYPGLGVWAKKTVTAGTRFGPLPKMTVNPDDPDDKNKMLDDYGKVKDWINHGIPQARHWTSYVRRAHESREVQHNIISVQMDDQVCYEAMQNISAGEEILLPALDDSHPERYPTSMLERDYHHFTCTQCGEVFRSQLALRQHETYLCHRQKPIVIRPQRISDLSSTTTITASVAPPTSDQSASRNKDQRGTLPLKSKVQEMIQDSQRTELPSPSQRVVHHDLSNTHPAHDLFSPRLNNGLASLKQFPCENCNKAYSDPIQLQRHIRSLHVGARSHTCTDCGKTFATSSGLKQHQHIHSSIKPFQCEVCLKAYTQFSNLCRHKRMHADCRQQIKCKDCGQTFSTMTSLGKHKRFCQGMLANGAGRISSYHHSTPSNLVPEKSCSMSNPSKMSAFANPYMSFYGQRPTFPFFPPVGAGLPMFPSSHPMAAMMSASMSDKKLSHHDKEHYDPRADLADSDSEERRQRWGSDQSNLSTTSDLAKSDIESGSESEHNFRNGLCESPRSMKTSSPALSSPVSSMGRNGQPTFDLTHKRKRSCSMEKPFDLSKTVSPSDDTHSESKSESGYGGEQPLDLSFKCSKDTPRKTHIFGGENKHEPKEKSVKEKLSPVPIRRKSNSPMVVRPLSPKAKHLSVEVPDKLHDAYPASSTSQMMLSRMYGAGMEKTSMDMYHEAARLMNMPHPRFGFAALPSPFNPFSSHLPGMFPPNPMDQTKTMGSGFMRHGAPFPYTPGMKLKDRYTCKFCGKIFPRSANLTRHLRTHTGEQPYKCKYCERSFSISSNLQRHIRNIHNKEKPFKCPICDRCFGQQTNLDRHLKKHEYEGPIVADSPLNEERDCDDLEPVNGVLGSTGSSGHASELSSPLKEDNKDVIDAAFSITGHMQKVEASCPSDSKDLDDSLEQSEGDLDWDHTDGDIEDEEDDLPLTKKTKHLNNNLPSDAYSHHVVNLCTGTS